MNTFGFIPIWSSAVPGWLVTFVRYGTIPVGGLLWYKGHKVAGEVLAAYGALYWAQAFSGIGTHAPTVAGPITTP